MHIPSAYKPYIEGTKQADLIAFTQVLICYLVERESSIDTEHLLPDLLLNMPSNLNAVKISL